MATSRDFVLSAPVRVVLVLGLLILALAQPASVVRAQDVTVCASNCDYASIQAAIDAVSGGSTITVADAVHTEGNITVSKSLTIRGLGSAKTIVQAHAQPLSANSRVFAVGAGVTVSIQDMTIRHGNVVASSAAGGGIHNGGALTLSQVTVTANGARGNDIGGGGPAYGGAIYNNGSLTMLSSFIGGNTTQGGDAAADYGGAGSAYGGGIYNNGELTVLNSSIDNNTTAGGAARGLYGAGGDAYGGGIYNNGRLTIQGTTISGNEARGGVTEGQYGYGGDAHGGGVAQWSSTTETIAFVNSTVSGNVSQGGDAVAEGSDAGSAFGGGVVHWWSPTGILDFVNCTISDNTAQAGTAPVGPGSGSAEGGGLRGSSGLRLSYCTVADNHVIGGITLGGGLYSSAGLGGGPEIKASIVADNDGPANVDGPDLFGNVNSQDYNLIANPEGYTLTGPADHNIEGVSPLLGPLQDNGGPTATRSLLRESPAVDHIPSGKQGCGTMVREDQRSLPRPQGIACDVGAFEREKTGQIELVKRLEPTTDSGRFHLQIDGVTERPDASDGSTTGKKLVRAGNHTVGELAGNNTSLADYNSRIECRDGGGTGTLVASQNNAGPLTVGVSDNDDIVCTVRNQRKLGFLEVVKDLVPNSDPGRFDLQIDGVTEKEDASEGGTTGKKTVPTGSHTVGELPGTDTSLADYATRIKCRDNGGLGDVVATVGSPGPLTVIVEENDDIVCTVRNNRRVGQLEVIKDLWPATDQGKFDLQIDGATTVADASDGDTSGKLSLPIGEHTVGEAAGTGTSLNDYSTSIQCRADGGEGSVVASGDGAGPLTVMMAEQDDIVCTISNERKTGQLKLVKDLIPTTDPGKFHLQIDGITRKADASHHDTTGKRTVFTGAHSVGEIAGTDTSLAAYASRIECRADGGTGEVVASGAGAGPLTVMVEENDLVVCRLTNTRRGTIVVQKQTNPEGGTSFGFTHDIAQPFSFSLDDGQAKEFANVVPGPYTVRETDPAILPGGYAVGHLACLDSDPGGTASTVDLDTRRANISLDAGETVTCTFTNEQLGTITIAKDAKPHHPQSFSFTGDLGRFFLDDDGIGSNAITFSNLRPGDYRVSETVPQDWHLKSLVCVDPDGGTSVDLGAATASVDLDPGEEVTCTFEDLKRGSITIAKNSRPDGLQLFEFTGDLQGFSLQDKGAGSNSATFTGLIPGDYEITELVPSDWDLTDILCLDSDHGTVVDLDRATAFIDLDPDEQVRCTFENTQRGSISIAKNAQPRGTQSFEFGGDLGGFSLVDDGLNANVMTFTNLLQGDYDVTELVPSDWDLIGIECLDLDGGTTADLEAALVSIDLDPGEHVVCTFENAQLPDLSLTKTVLPSTVLPGQPVTYTMVYSNAGTGLAPHVVITDIVPAPLTQIHFQSDPVITPAGSMTYTWSVGDLIPGDGGVITLTGIISPALVTGVTFTNTASMSTTVVEKNTSNNRDAVRVTVPRLAPLAVDDSYSTLQNTPLVSGPLSVLDNDEALVGNALTAVLDGGPVSGVLTLALDGTFIYTPALDFVGVDTFTYYADDGTLTSNIATVAITVTAAIHPAYLPTVVRR